jgi:type I restriction enzyme M protein
MPYIDQRGYGRVDAGTTESLAFQDGPMSASFQQLANFIWSVADLLRGPYRPPQYERVMLPLTVLRRFDAVLAPSKEAVLKRYAELSNKGIPSIDAILNNLAKG